MNDIFGKPDPAATDADKESNVRLVVDLTKEGAKDSPNYSVIPQYRSHKIVRAFKIGKIDADVELALTERRQTEFWIVPEDKALPQVKVSLGYMQRHRPLSGGYFVIYDDNYFSFSPAEPFENGYTLLGQTTAQDLVEAGFPDFVTLPAQKQPAKIGDTEVTHGMKVRSKASGENSPVMTIIHGSPDKTAWLVEWHHDGQRIVRPADFGDLEEVK